jgi:hypothetical protein
MMGHQATPTASEVFELFLMGATVSQIKAIVAISFLILLRLASNEIKLGNEDSRRATILSHGSFFGSLARHTITKPLRSKQQPLEGGSCGDGIIISQIFE